MSGRLDSVAVWLDGMAADLRDEDRFAHGEAWDQRGDRGLGRCAYCPGDQPWPCEWQQKVDRLGKQVAYIRDHIVADPLTTRRDPRVDWEALERLVDAAIRREEITASRGAEILGLRLMTWRERALEIRDEDAAL